MSSTRALTVENLRQNITDRTFNLVKTGLEVCHAKLKCEPN